MQPGEGTPTEAILDGRYQLGECIGEGGMARVHRGFDHALGRAVAIKVMREGTENAAALERARGEMGVLASLSHPSLVTLFDARIAPGRVSYLVMELVDGPTLSDRLREGELDPRDVAPLASDLAEALHAVHAAGIVHRDVKPSNVLLSPSSRPGRTYRARLADFGIAYLADSSRLTTPGVVVGTMAYLAPEQVNGAPPAPPADVYALGLLLLEALTGERPFGGIGGVESLVTRVTTAPTVPDAIGQDWADLLRAMTALDPSARPTALEVADRVAALRPPVPVTTPTAVLLAGFDGQDASAETDVVPAPAATRRRRRRFGMLAGAASVVAVGVFAVGAWLLVGGTGVPAPASSPAVVSEPSIAPSESAPSDEVPAETEDAAVTPVDSTIVDSDSTTPVTDTAPDAGTVDQPVAPEQAPAPVSPGADTASQKAAEEAQKAAEREAAKAAEEAQRAAEKAAREEAKEQNAPGKKP